GAIGHVVKNDQAADVLLVPGNQRGNGDVERGLAIRRVPVGLAGSTSIGAAVRGGVLGSRAQDKFVDVMDAGIGAYVLELLGQIGGEQSGERLSNRLLARDAGEPLDLRVPALHAIIKPRRQDADVDGFNDV